MPSSITRRQFAALGAATAGATALGLRPGQAQQQRLVLGTFGGDTQRITEEAILRPILDPKGINTVIEAAPGAARRLKLLAERRLPRGTYDVVNLIGPMLYELSVQDIFEPLDTSRLDFYDSLPPAFQNAYYVPNMATRTVILYNPAHVSPAPTSYRDLWKPEYAGKVGFVDFDYGRVLSAAALTNGGGMSDYEPGKEKLMELRESGVMIYPSNEALGQALQSGECWIAIMLQSRGIMWQRAGVPIEIAFAEEGFVHEWWGMAIPKNSQNKDAAYEFINAALSDQAQRAWAENMWAVAPMTGAMDKLDDSVRAFLEVPPEVDERMLPFDEEYWAKNNLELKDWWDRVFKG